MEQVHFLCDELKPGLLVSKDTERREAAAWAFGTMNFKKWSNEDVFFFLKHVTGLRNRSLLFSCKPFIYATN